MKILFPKTLLLFVFAGLNFFDTPLQAAEQPRISREQAEALVAGLHFREGEIDLKMGLQPFASPTDFVTWMEPMPARSW